MQRHSTQLITNLDNTRHLILRTQILPHLQITLYILTARNTTGSNHCIILLSSWWWAYWCQKHVEQTIRSAIKTSVASSWHFISTSSYIYVYLFCLQLFYFQNSPLPLLKWDVNLYSIQLLFSISIGCILFINPHVSVKDLLTRRKIFIVQSEGQTLTRQTQRGGGGVASTHSQAGARRLVVSTTFQLLYLTGRARYPLYRMLGESAGRSGWKGKYRSHRDTIPVAIRYTD